MEEKLINFIPYLRDLFIDSENKEQELSEDLELNEDKIPGPLLKAYSKNVWNNSGVTARDVSNRHLELKALHDYSDYRYNARTDWGKATYNKLTKQQAADLLGLKVTAKTVVDGRKTTVEVGMDEPIPEKCDVTVDNQLVSENLANLRFLVNDGNNSWSLIEYEYRTENGRGNETEQYFPIFRQSFPYKKLHDLGIETIDNHDDDDDEVKITDIRGWKKAKSLYYAIKISDLIFETNEYSMSEIKDTYNPYVKDENGNRVNLNLNNIRSNYYNLLYISVYANYISEVFKKNNIEITTEFINKFSNSYVREFLKFVKYLSDNNLVIDINTNIDDIVKIIYDNRQEFSTIISNGSYIESELKNYLFNKNEVLVSAIGNTLATELQNSYDVLKSEVDRFKKLWNKTSIATERIKQIINKQLDRLPNNRETELLRRRIMNNWTSSNLEGEILVKNPAEPQEVNGMDFTPFTTFLNNSEEENINVSDVYDTGYHSSRNIFSKVNNADYIIAKKNYISALNNLNKIKKLQPYYDNEDEYNEEYNEARLEFLKAKALYLGGEYDGQKYVGERNKLRNKIRGYVRVNDKEFINHWNKVAQHYYYLQSTFEKLLKLRNAARAITTYSKDTLINLYGSVNTEKLKELEEKIQQYQDSKEDIERRIQDRRRKIEELQRQIAEQEQQLSLENGNLESVIKQISSFEKEKDENCGSMEEIIKKAYKQQDELIKQSEELDNSLKAYKAKLGHKKITNNTKQTKEIDDRLNTLFNVFKELSNENDPSEDDILSDEEE